MCAVSTTLAHHTMPTPEPTPYPTAKPTRKPTHASSNGCYEKAICNSYECVSTSMHTSCGEGCSEIECRGAYSCAYSEFHCEAEDCIITCEGHKACYGAQIYEYKSTSATLSCLTGDACESVGFHETYSDPCSPTPDPTPYVPNPSPTPRPSHKPTERTQCQKTECNGADECSGHHWKSCDECHDYFCDGLYLFLSVLIFLVLSPF